MTPIRLTFEAFGPYVDRQVIDFTKFYSSGLVLIHGETGAGKTVILDAMTYALYGKSSGGSRGDITSMRCQRAPDDRVTQVEYEFAIRDRHYRFVRRLHARKKRNGTVEFLPEQSALYLNEEETWVPFFENPRLRDVEGKAMELIGLSYEQFCQVMILPQGKFERLLTSKSEEKESILSTLFHADHWQELANWLCKQAVEQNRCLEQERAEIKSKMDLWGCTTLEEMEEKQRLWTEELRKCDEQRTFLQKEINLRKTALDGALQLAEQFRKLDSLRAELTVLAASAPEAEQWQLRLDRGHHAQKVLPAWQKTAELALTCKQKTEELRKSQAALADAEKAEAELHGRLAALEAEQPEQQKRQEELARLKGKNQVYETIDSAEKNCRQAQSLWQQLVLQEQKASETVARMQGEEKLLANEREQLFLQYTSQIPAMQAESDRLSAKLERLRQCTELRARLKDTRAKLARQKGLLEYQNRELQSHQKNLAVLRNAYLDSAVHQLVLELKKGEPCPVCGSIHHPAPRVPSGMSCTREEVQQAETALEGIRNQTESLREHTAQLTAEEASLGERIQAMEEELKDLPENGAARFAALQKQLTEARKKDALRLSHEKELTALRSRLETEQQKALQLSAQLDSARQNKDRCEAQCEALRLSKEPDIPDLAHLLGRQKLLSDAIQAFAQKLERTQKEHRELQLQKESLNGAIQHQTADYNAIVEEGKKQKEIFLAQMMEEGFAERKDFHEACISQEELTVLQQKITAYQTQMKTLQEQTEALTAELSGKEKPHPEELEAALRSCTDRMTELTAQWGGISQRLTQLTETFCELNKLQKKIEKDSRSYEKRWEFAKAVRGDNGISLRRYVLGIMLSYITAEANRLLKQVHGGRYQLYRTMEGTERTRKVGLDLEVLDGTSGKRRSVSSLSGGEKFLVSLSLALGLSGVVQAQSGGIRMDAMFIDEGFGSLDPTSIADALDVLAAVRGSRQLIGIISHVESLRENIHTTIEVKKEQEGSRLVLHI